VRKPPWKLIWGAWVAYFAVAETIAVRSGEEDAPFCYVLRHSLGIRHPHPVARQAGQIALGAGIVWFIAHLYEEYEIVTPR
jgi:hypothetical protein